MFSFSQSRDKITFDVNEHYDWGGFHVNKFNKMIKELKDSDVVSALSFTFRLVKSSLVQSMNKTQFK